MGSGLTESELRCDMAVAAFDRVARDMDRKWGIDRLPELVSQETADRYAVALSQMNAAISAGDIQLTQHKANVCIRGMSVMDQEATSLGHLPATGDFWEVQIGGFKAAILKDGCEWQAAAERRPDLKFFTLREAALAIRAYCEALPVLEAKAQFPGAEIVKADPLPASFFDAGGDQIPF